MRIAAQKVNNEGIRVSKSKMIAATEKYSKQYNHMCECLYDMGYLSSPTYFYEDEFWGTFFEDNKDFIPKFLNSHTGAMNYSLSQIKYVLRTISDSDIHKVFTILIKLLEAKQALEDYNKFCSSVKFQKKSDLVLCKSNLTVSNHVYNSGKIPLDSPYVQECFYFDNKKIIKVNYAKIIFNELLRSLDLDCDFFDDSDSVLLGDGFTIKDDYTFLNQVINGEIVGNGKYADILHSTVEKYYDDYYATRTTIAECVGYAEKNFISSIPACIEFLNNYRKQLPEGYKEVYVTSSEVWFQVDEPNEKSDDSLKNIFVGQFLFDFSSHNEISLVSRLFGFSGEYIYEYDPSISKYTLCGLPVTMYQIGNQRGRNIPVELRYYPVINIKKEVNNVLEDVFPKTIVGDRSFISKEDMLKFLEIDSLDTLDLEVADIVSCKYKEHTLQFKHLVGILVQTLVCMMCDYTLEGHESPNHIVLTDEFDWLTKETYLDACIEAEILFNKLGF